MAIVIVDLDILVVVVLFMMVSNIAFQSECEETHVMDDSDCDIAGLFRWIGRRLVGEEGIAEAINVPPLCLVGDLLASPFPLERNLGFRVLAVVGGEGGRRGGAEGGIGAVATRVGGACGSNGVQRGVVLRAQILDVVTGGLDSGSGSVVVSSPLLGGLASRGGVVGARGHTICDFAAGVGLGLGGVVDDDDLLGEAILVEGVPVGLARAATLPRVLVSGIGHGGGRVIRVVSGRWVVGRRDGTGSRGLGDGYAIRPGGVGDAGGRVCRRESGGGSGRGRRDDGRQD